MELSCSAKMNSNTGMSRSRGVGRPPCVDVIIFGNRDAGVTAAMRLAHGARRHDRSASAFGCTCARRGGRGAAKWKSGVFCSGSPPVLAARDASLGSALRS